MRKTSVPTNAMYMTEPTDNFKYAYYLVYLIKNKRFIFLGKKITKKEKEFDRTFDIKQIIPECLVYNQGKNGEHRGSYVFEPNSHNIVITTSRDDHKTYKDYIK